jgi:hypothetical protein
MSLFERKTHKSNSMLCKHPVQVCISIIVGIVFVYDTCLYTYAADINATITTGLFVPLLPLNLAVSVDDQSVDLSWSPPSSDGGSAITDYVIEYKQTSDGVWLTFSDGVSTNPTTTVDSLMNDISYDFRVSAVNAIGQGSPTPAVSATPGAPAQVSIVSVSDVSIPSIVAEVRIMNDGVSAYTYQYSWCVTNSEVNLCGGGDDVFSSSASRLIQSGEEWATNLNATVLEAGTYWFHLEAAFGSDTAYASQSFVAVSVTESSEEESRGGSSSSGGGSRRSRSCVGADSNRDGKVNLVDFSILIAFYNVKVPLGNPCADINNDGKVNVVDFSILLTQWGKKPTVFKALP